GFSRAPAQVFGRLTGFKEATLRDREPLIGLALRPLELGDRGAGFGLAPVDRLALVLRLSALERELSRLLLDARRFVRGALDLGLQRHDGLFLLVVFGVERGDGVLRLRDRHLEGRGLLGKADERFPFGADAIGQVLDLALGLEDAARLTAIAA